MKRVYKTAVMVLACLLTFDVHAMEYDASKKLKTLFTTPHERQQLDELRDSGKFSKSQNRDSTGPVSQPLKVDVRGIVIRELGQPVVWVNDGNTLSSEKIEEGVRVRSEFIRTEPLVIPVRVDDRTLKMKPGQQWDELNGKIQDSYQIKE